MELIIRPKVLHSAGAPRYRALVRPVTENVSDDYVNLLYQIPYEYDLKGIEEHIKRFGGANSWRDSIGTQGIWTVKYTKQWLLEKFIPKVINFFDENHKRLLDARCRYYMPLFQKHYKPLFQNGNVSSYQDCFDWFDEIQDLGERSNNDISLEEVNDVKYLIPYIEDIETLIARCPQGISSSLLRSYYKTFTKLCRRSNPPLELLDQFNFLSFEDRKPKAVHIEYIAGNICAAESETRTLEIGKGQSEKLEWLEWTVQDVLNGLQRQVVRIDAVEFEKSRIADYLSRSFKAILAYWNVQCSQTELNVAKQALLPLLEENRFEDHYVMTHRKQFIEISELEF